jgi:hypothetical protein
MDEQKSTMAAEKSFGLKLLTATGNSPTSRLK